MQVTVSHQSIALLKWNRPLGLENTAGWKSVHFYIGSGCPADYTALGGSCYRLMSRTNKYSLEEGAALCKEHGGGHIITIDSEAENYLIAQSYGFPDVKTIVIPGT